jgi:two-component system, chemotaxis family, sensor kinase CheA
MDDILRDFVIETTEAIDQVDNEMVRFEREPNNGAILSQIFRLVHTVKGTCGFLGLPRLESLSHAAETVIGQFRDGVPVTKDAVTLILATIDRIKVIIAGIEEEQQEPTGADDDLIGALDDMARSQANARFAKVEGPSHTTGTLIYQVLERPLKPGEASLDDLEAAFRSAPGPSAQATKDTHAAKEASAKPAHVAHQLSASLIHADKADGDGLSEVSAQAADTLLKQTIRVNIDTIDQLMTMVSELVLTRNQLIEISRKQNDSAFKLPLQRLSSITAELQDAVMKTRMQPIGSAWAKLPRLVRDLTVELRKEFDLEMKGAETEIDRHVLELIKDPLTHMIRNSADHGIESPEDRVMAGKKRRGKIRVSASQSGGYILLEISDDGRGINKERVLQKAIDNGMVTPEAAATMSDGQIYKLIFKAGLSTAASVTNVSGRGVGMDVVVSNVEQVGGTVDVRSSLKLGTSILIKIPVTLAIAAALVVEVDGSRFAIPQIAVMELVRTREGFETRIEEIGDSKLLRLRNELLPLMSLHDVLAMPGEPNETGGGFIVVCQVAGRRFGLIVDSVVQTEEIVVKPVSQLLRLIRAYSGTTILGDGSVVMIVDPSGIAQEAGLLNGDAGQFDNDDAAISVGEADPKTALLVFRAGSEGYKAVPLALVTRLEEVDQASIEYAGGRPMVQYRGKLMPLLSLTDSAAQNPSARQQVLVFSFGQSSAGLLVDQIIDIVDEKLDVSAGAEREGLIGSAIINGRATDIVDVATFLPFELQGQDTNDNAEPKTVLLADDSDFFTSLIGPVIKAAGYRLAVAASNQVAAKLITGGGIDLVLINLDSEKLSGIELCHRIKSDDALGALPVVGMAAKGGPEIIERARSAGMDDLVGRMDRQGLMASIKDLLDQQKEAA